MSQRIPFTRQDSIAGLEPESDKASASELGELDHKQADEYAANFAEEKNIPLADSESCEHLPSPVRFPRVALLLVRSKLTPVRLRLGRAISAAPARAVQAVADELTLEEARAIIQNTVKAASTDPNFDQNLLRRAVDALKQTHLSAEAMKDLVEEIRLEAALIDDSPYLEVRSVVDNFDDPTIPVDTFRSWVLGMLLTTIGTGINMFFAPRYPGISVSASAAQVVAYPFAKAMEKFLPTKQWTMFGRQWSLNPGPFSQKEHMLITVMANVSFGTA